MIEIISRERWGARYADGDAAAHLPAAEVWLHHSATGAQPPGASFEADAAAVRVLEGIGQDRFGWGISYSFVVPLSGRVFEGHSIGRRGTHTGGRNSISRAVCLLGNYEEVRPSAAQIVAVASLVRHGYLVGWWTAAALSGGHRDAPGASTLCPGRWAYAAIPEINRAAVIVDPGIGHGDLPTLRYRERGEAVYRLQLFLTRNFPSYAKFSPTAYYGEQTVAAVAEFQRRTGVTGPDADGTIVGPRTNEQLYRLGYRG